ncbi:MAG: clathrin associated protein complex large subunit [Cyphobasidiales sp. Tagirdzhanova-0007]|nr:MAG: clathrin associated protein complex large subunit [Cyphobasidiales sp. Tagirdzhanova-0007]
MVGYYNLKSLIKAIRSCKTLADERAVIVKESAAIRTSFKEEDSFARHHNIAKLLYIHMLGYPAHFGQIECLKLVASPRFADKRLGYLGIMLLLDENTEVLTLVTNSLKNDMNHSNMYIVGLALGTFANIASEEMSRDLINEVEKLMGSSNTYIRKKAALCAMRIVHKVPDLSDHFVSRSTSLLSDRNHGVLLCGITLVTDMCAMDQDTLNGFRKAVPLLVRHLKALVTTGYSPEHDVSSITDPFLQVKTLRLLRLLGKGDSEASQTMNDILAQVATNTESAKNVGNSILYEAVLTILDIEADQALRVMAINILGKFLSNRDNNIRYVALNTLNKVVTMDTNAVQRHRTIILDCLRDGDISIRRRALELSYALVNETNVRVLTRELLAFLEVADNEFKLGLTTQICLAAERFAPNKRWHIDTVLRVLKLAGNFVREEVLSAFIRLVAHTPELQPYTVQKLYLSLRSDVSQESLTLSGVWIIGEYGDVLLTSSPAGMSDEGSTDPDGGTSQSFTQAQPGEVIDLFEQILSSPYINSIIRQYVIVASTKFSTRLDEVGSIPDIAELRRRLEMLVGGYQNSVELEIQQRSVEFGVILSGLDQSIKMGVLERMPPPELKASVMGTVSEKRAVGSTRVDKDSLLDLGGDDSAPSPVVPQNAQSTQDLLADIFGSGPAEASSMPARPVRSNVNDIMSLFGGGDSMLGASSSKPSDTSASNIPNDIFSSPSFPSSTPTTTVSAAPASISAFTSPISGLVISFTPSKDVSKPNIVNVTARFSSSPSTSGAISGVSFQAAVPKTMKLQMMAISNPDIQPGAPESTQLMRVMVPPGAQIRLRIRISYAYQGEPRTEQTDFTFPIGSY